MYYEIVNLIRRAAKKARNKGIPNLLQPGLIKEMIIADLLGHQLNTDKRDFDAYDPNNPQVRYEYLSCKEGGAGQFDRMFKSPLQKRKRSLERITRNDKIYLAIFYESDQTKVKVIYELEPKAVAAEAESKLKRSKNNISHVGFSEKWALEYGKKVYPI